MKFPWFSSLIINTSYRFSFSLSAYIKNEDAEALPDDEVTMRDVAR